MRLHDIDISQRKVAASRRRCRIRRPALLGSILRDDFTPDSDIDALMEFEPGCVAGLLTMAGREVELCEILGRKVDLRTPAELGAIPAMRR